MERIKKINENEYFLLTFSNSGIFISIRKISKQEYEDKYKDIPIIEGADK